MNCYNRLIESLHYHREYSEIRDPFGTEVGDDRWIERFGPTNIRATGGLERLPPAVVSMGNGFILVLFLKVVEHYLMITRLA